MLKKPSHLSLFLDIMCFSPSPSAWVCPQHLPSHDRGPWGWFGNILPWVNYAGYVPSPSFPLCVLNVFIGFPTPLSNGPLPPLAFLLLLLYSWNLSFCTSPSLLVLTLPTFGFPNSNTIAYLGNVFVLPPSSLSLLPPSTHFLSEFEINQELQVYLCWPSAMLACWKKLF